MELSSFQGRSGVTQLADTVQVKTYFCLRVPKETGRTLRVFYCRTSSKQDKAHSCRRMWIVTYVR